MTEKEADRLIALNKYENEMHLKGYDYVAGVDEAGRGPLAGPVVAAAVILQQGVIIEGLDDSKKLSAKKREILFDVIKSNCVSFCTGIVSEKDIDSINILNATKTAMMQAVNGLKPAPHCVLIDAVKLDQLSIPQLAIIRGDSVSASIAAASIIAKVTRDRIIEEYGRQYPQYGFEKHKGYGTKQHIEAIKQYGACPIHRLSFIKKFIDKSKL